MATKTKKIDKTEDIIESQEELIQPEELEIEISELEKVEDVSDFDFGNGLNLEATIEKASEEIKTVEAPLPEKEKLYKVVRLENEYLFAVDGDGKYIMLRREGKYKNTKFGDIISQ